MWTLGHRTSEAVLVGNYLLLNVRLFNSQGDVGVRRDSHQLRRWYQELMGYNFVVINMCARMMKDVDALTRHFGKAIALYCMQVHLMRSGDILRRPLSYDFENFHTAHKLKSILPSSPLTTDSQTFVPTFSSSVVALPIQTSIAIPSSIRILYHSAIMFSSAPSQSINPPVNPSRKPLYTTLTSHQSLV